MRAIIESDNCPSRFFLLTCAVENEQSEDMKRYVVTALAIASSICLRAQDAPAANTGEEGAKKIWTTEFKSLDIDAPVKVTVNKISENEAPYVTYDAAGDESVRFTAEADKKGVLKIREKRDGKRERITGVEIYCHEMDAIRISRADVVFRDTLDVKMADVEISNGAHIRATIDVIDIKLDISEKCVVELTGQARYMTANVSSSVLDASSLRCMSCSLEASHKSQIDVHVAERLDAQVSYGAKIGYSGTPEIVRTSSSVFGGEIIDRNQNGGKGADSATSL